jgi:phosphoglucomutase
LTIDNASHISILTKNIYIYIYIFDFGRIIVAGDGRYYNTEAMQIICRVLAANGVAHIWVPRGGIMSTPAVSAAIRTLEGGKAQGGIVLTASHNPGGPGEDFGIKYNEGFGQPAGEEFTDSVSFKLFILNTILSKVTLSHSHLTNNTITGSFTLNHWRFHRSKHWKTVMTSISMPRSERLIH